MPINGSFCLSNCIRLQRKQLVVNNGCYTRNQPQPSETAVRNVLLADARLPDAGGRLLAVAWRGLLDKLEEASWK